MLFSTEHFVPADLDHVFRFFADPRNLPAISPPGTRLVRLQLIPIPGEERLAGPGSLIEISTPLRIRWTARILEFEYGKFFRDNQERGPFRRWLHTHSFRGETHDGREGTIVRDEVDYATAFGRMGDLAVRPMLQVMFAQRQRATERIFKTL